MSDLVSQLSRLNVIIGELADCATEQFAIRTLERARRKARDIETRLFKLGRCTVSP